MKCTTKADDPNEEKEGKREANAAQDPRLAKGLQKITGRVDLEGTARYSKAFLRAREIQSAFDLLRYVFMYSLQDYSMQQVGLWGTVMGLGSLCKSAVRKRLCNCRVWLGMLIMLLLCQQNLRIVRRTGVRVRLFDTTKISAPGSATTEWNLHVGLDLGRLSMDALELTDCHSGETLTRWAFQPGEICLADRSYGVLRSLGVVLAAAAWFVIRIGWQNLPLQHQDGTPFDLIAWLRVQSPDPAATPGQAQVWVSVPQGRFPIRLITRAIPPEKAARLRKNMLAEAKHKHRQIDERSLLAVGFVMVVSNLPDPIWSAREILDLYRLRWQVELFFKRLKSILQLDHLRTHDAELAQVYLLAKILAALILGEVQMHFWQHYPQTLLTTNPAINHWRVTQLCFDALRDQIRGDFSLSRIFQHLDQCQRYLSDGQRKRINQWAQARDCWGLTDDLFFGEA